MNQDFLQRAIENAMVIARASGLFSSSAQFQKPSGVFTGGGSPNGVYIDVPGLAPIACQKAINGDPSATVKAEKQREVATQTSVGPWHILLDGLYPAVETGWRGTDTDSAGAWRVLVTDVDSTVAAYDIRGVERDSQGQMTRIEAFKVTI